jgi:hypothetical protein
VWLRPRSIQGAAAATEVDTYLNDEPADARLSDLAAFHRLWWADRLLVEELLLQRERQDGGRESSSDPQHLQAWWSKVRQSYNSLLSIPRYSALKMTRSPSISCWRLSITGTMADRWAHYIISACFLNLCVDV